MIGELRCQKDDGTLRDKFKHKVFVKDQLIQSFSSKFTLSTIFT